jgi:hypothetical protein
LQLVRARHFNINPFAAGGGLLPCVAVERA